MEHFLGIDIGGTHIKFGIVNEFGVISHYDSFHTKEWLSGDGVLPNLIHQINKKTQDHTDILKIGIGVPGLVDIKRETILEVPAISDLNGVPLLRSLRANFPSITFHMENDAGAAAMGELMFNQSKVPDSYIFTTVGTGIGGAAILNRKLFMGADGNSMEFGHMISRNQLHLENLTGKMGILNCATKLLNDFPRSAIHDQVDDLSISVLLKAAEAGDELAQLAFEKSGFILAEGLVAVIRIMDLAHIIVGGGISVAFDHLNVGFQKAFNRYLTPYYLTKLEIKPSELGNDAGILGAVAPFVETVTNK